MSRLLIVIIILMLLLPSTSTAQDNSCAYGGEWRIAYSFHFEYGSTVVEGSAIWTENAEVNIKVNCSGSDAILTGSTTGEINVANTLGGLCSGEFIADLTGNVTDSAAGFPIFTIKYLTFEYLTSTGNCDQGSGTGTAAQPLRELDLHTDVLAAPGYYNGSLITKFILADVIPDEEVISEVYIIEAWRIYHPTVSEVNSQYNRYFIRDVPVDNTFTFTIDWDGAEDPTAEISVHGGPWEVMTVNNNEATYTVSVEDLPLTAADFASTKRIDLMIDIRFPFTEDPPTSLTQDLIRMTVIDLPTWATAQQFMVVPGDDTLIYRYTKKIPTQPIQTLTVDIPSWVPVIGGKWGLESVQMDVTAEVHSQGGPHSKPITGTGALHLGGKSYDVEFTGSVGTNIDSDGAIQVGTSPFDIKLSEPIDIEDSQPVITFVPALGTLFTAPIIGQVITAFFSLVHIDWRLVGNLTGTGYIGVLPDGSLGITEGTATPSLSFTFGTTAKAGGLAWLGVYGTIGGDIDLDLAQNGAIKACNIQIGFTIVAGALEIGSDQVEIFQELPICNP